MAGSHHVGLDTPPQHSLLVMSVSPTVDTCITTLFPVYEMVKQGYLLAFKVRFLGGGGGGCEPKLPCWNFWTVYEGQEPSRNRVLVPARQATYRLAESIPWNRFLGFIEVSKYRLWIGINGRNIPRRVDSWEETCISLTVHWYTFYFFLPGKKIYKAASIY